MNFEKTVEAQQVSAFIMPVNIGGGGCTTEIKTERLLDGRIVRNKHISTNAITWFPPKKIQFVNTAQKAVKTAEKLYGVKYAEGIYIIPLKNREAFSQEIEKIEAIFWQEAQDRIDNFYRYVEEFLSENEDIREPIEKIIDGDYLVDGKRPYTREEFYERFKNRFFFSCLTELPLAWFDEEHREALLSDVTASVWEETCKSVNEFIKQFVLPDGRDYFTQAAVGHLNIIKSRLIDLSFADESKGIDNVVERFEEIMANLPKTGRVEKPFFDEVCTFLHKCSSVAHLKLIASGEDIVEEEESTPHTLSLGLVPEDDIAQDGSTVQQQVKAPQSIQQSIPVTPGLFDDWDDEEDESLLHMALGV